MKKHLLFLFAALLPMLASAQTKVEVDGIWYNLTADTREAEVTRSGGTSYSGSITIPTSVNYDGVKYRVTSIENFAFAYCSSLATITIPESVTSIGNFSFDGCSRLKSFTCRALTPPTVSPNTFYGVDKSILIYVHASYMPDYQSAEWWSEFSNYQYINADAAGDELFTFSDWSSYNQWQANSSSSETYTFSVYPESVFFFDWQVSSEEGYDKLIVTLDGVEILNESGEKSGHYQCLVSSGDHTLVVEYTKDYGGDAGNDCATITNIVLAKPAIASGTCGSELMWRFTDNGRLIISGMGDMFDFENRERVPWYNHLKEILSVTIEEGLTSIGECAFADCSSLTAITIPEGVTSIGAYAFVECSNLERVEIPTSMESIAETAFNSCRKLRHILIDRKNSVYFSGESNTCIIELSTKTLLVGTIYGTIPNGIEHLGNFAFSGRNVEDIVIPNGVISLGEYTFCGECSIRSITIPPSLKHVGSWTFDEGSLINKGCPNLSAVYIEDLKAWLELDFPYHYCAPLYYAHNLYLNGERLEVITIPEGVISLKRNAFAGWNGSEVIFPESLTEISSGAFNSCENLAAITCHAMNPPICNSAFFDVDKSIPVYIPKESIDTYRTAEGWREFINFRPIMKPVTVITLNLTSATLTEEESLTLTATVSPDEADDKTITWNSNNPSVATVDNMGKVTAIAPGTATITATANGGSGVSASCEVTVVEASYTITYLVDGEVHHQDTLTRGTTIEPIENPIKEGYTFSGWSEIPETMPAKNITISSTFTVNKYHVTFEIGNEVVASYYLDYGTAIVAPKAPEKEGHTFNGWGKVSETVPAGDVTYKGNYSVNSYLLTYTVDSKIVQTDSVPYGTAITAPAEPAKEGYTFSGWNKIPKTMPAENVTISGTFTINKYLVTFKIDDEVIVSDSLEYGASIVTPEAPKKEGYTFDGWKNLPNTVPASDVVIEGSYTTNEYLLTFIIEEALYEMRKVKFNEEIDALEIAEKEGHTLVWENWIDKMPAKDYTVRGKYILNRYTINYVIDNEIAQTDSVFYGEAITIIAEPTKEGHTFSGWSEIPSTMPAEDVTISGTFTINKYLVTFKIDDEVIVSDSLEYGASIVTPEAPTKEGHTFAGWGEVAATVPASDVTYEGTYTVNSYTVIFKIDDEVIYSESIAYGTAIVAPEAPEKEGHTFAGWGEVAATVPASDVTYEGTYTVNNYTVTFKIDDEVIYSESMAYGTAIVAPEAPEKEGHNFNGWGEVAATVPAGDVTYEGSYTVNTYNVYYYVGEELVHTAEVAYGEAIPEYSYEPTIDGDVFVGWIGENYETMPAHDVTYTANIESGIDQLMIENSQSSIYDLTGRKVTDTENLKGGIYIINGRKVVIK